ncbi:MAG TPA: HAD hydrolase-like protein, partial [Sporolactobacillaceae bacterium]|nr:HAD hydrolase-like protein [Sporolactobacillaceae bacterium]
MGHYKVILFDLDGTLTDPKEGITKSVQYALEKFGIVEPDLNQLEHFIGPPLQVSFSEAYGFDEEQAKKAIAYYRQRFTEKGMFENVVYPGIPQLLKELKGYGYKLIVAT